MYNDERKVRDDFVLYCPIELARLKDRGVRKGRYKMTSIGLEKQCTCCLEFWPADSEFFFPAKGRGLHSYCKACYRYKKHIEPKKNKDAA